MTPPRREINCGHCGATHPTVSEVRACATDNPAASHELPPIELSPNAVSSSAISANTVSPKAPSRKAPSRKAESTKQAPARQSRKRQQAVVTAPVTQPASATPARQVSTVPDVSAPVLRNARLLAGPHALGRSVLVRPDTDVPTEWSDCDEVAASEASDLDVVERLHRAWRERERLVIRWSGPLPDSAVVVNEPFYKLDPGYEIPGERLLFAATANAVNLLDGAPERASFWPLSVAVGLGASVITADGSQNAGDVTLGGTPDDNNEQVTAWIDGGPLDLTLPGRCNALVVPRANWQAGTLTPTTVIAEPTAELADDQLAAVSHKGGSARILAPAGSGKTRVLTERARYLVGAPTSAEVSINRATKGRTGIEPAAVSLVAYNRRAKDEMRERLSDIGRLDIRTLNSMALAIAAGTGPFRRVSPDRTPTTINELDARRILGRLVPGRRRQRLTDPLEPWVDALAACRLGLRDPHEVESAYGGDIVGFPEVLANYRSELAKQNLLDFDEQIVRASERLLAEPAVRSVARAYAPLLLVDEFQDLTPAHLLLIRLIAGPPGDVFAVGDDDQTIYGYAGASPDWLINFDTYFPGSSDYRLTVNYRCLQPVVAAATNLLSYNQRRVTKTINAGSEAKHSNTVGDSLTVYNKGDAQDNLLAHVLQLVKAGAEPSEIAVLSRVHAALLPAAMFLTNSGIPVVGTPGIGLGMLERSGVGAALSWLRLATAPDRGFQAEDLRLALRRPPRSLHPRVADWACEQGSINDLLKLAQRLNTEREANTIAEFASDITNLRKLIERGGDTETLLSTLYTDVGLLGAATQLDTSQRTARRAAHSDELTALMAVARLHPEPKGFERWLREHLTDLPQFNPDEPMPGVVLATVHTTKGLEWPHVVVHDCRDDLYPHRLATDIEEERRIFHVALTRGRFSVGITTAGPPSRFIAELKAARPSDKPWPQTQVVSPSTASNGTSTARPISTSSNSGSSSSAGKRARPEPSSPKAARLRDALTDWRRQRSKADSVPAYVVLGNQTLDAVSETFPSDLAALGKISGIGAVKLERYGADILGIVASIDD